MVEVPTVLVVGEDERGLRPHVGRRHERPERARREIVSRCRRPGRRVFRGRLRRHDPRHLWQVARRHVRCEGVPGPNLHPTVEERVGLGQTLEVGEELEHVVAVVVLLLIHPPRHPGALQSLRVGLPAERALEVLEHRSAAEPVGVDGAGHRVHAVGRGGADHRTERVVAEREGVGECVGVGNVLGREVAHVGDLESGERVALPTVPVGVLQHPGVPRIRPVRPRRRRGVEAVGQDESLGMMVAVLIPDRSTVGTPRHVGIVEPAHPLAGAEVVVERAVLLDEDHDVIDVVDRRRLRPSDGRVRGLGGRARGVGLVSGVVGRAPCHGARRTRRQRRRQELAPRPRPH